MKTLLTPQQWCDVERLFHAACESPTGALNDLLRELRDTDPEVERVVRALLEADADAHGLDARVEVLMRALLE